MKKINSVVFKVVLKGSGIVNFDSDEQKNILYSDSNLSKKFSNKKNDNNVYAKKSFYKDENGNLKYKIKISGAALRHKTFGEETVSQSPTIMHENHLLNSFIASPMGIVRGYTFMGNRPLNKKSPLCIVAAEQINDAVSNMEICTASGERTNNCLFNTENIGSITYETIGNIDIKELQFVSADVKFARCGLYSDYFNLYKSYLGQSLNSFNPDTASLGYYKLAKSCLVVRESEFGLKFSNENVLELVKYTLKNIASIVFNKVDAYANVLSLKIKLVDNPLIGDMYDDSIGNWTEIKSFDEIDNLSFEMNDYYELCDADEAIKLNETANKNRKDSAEYKAELKRIAKEKAAADKEEKDRLRNETIVKK